MTLCVTLGAGSAPSRPRPMWTPRHLFRAGYVGAWYDPADRRSLFQDKEGTIPVTASGQPVGLMQDKSGNGHHMVQGLAAARPTYRRVNGKSRLDFDGVDDRMQMVKSIDLNAGAILLALRESDTASTHGTLLSPLAGGYIALTGTGAARSLGKNNGPTIPIINTPAVFGMREPMPAMIRIMGGEIFASRPSSEVESYNSTPGAGLLSGALMFGAFSTAGELPFQGQLNAMVLLTTQLPANLVRMTHRYLAARMIR